MNCFSSFCKSKCSLSTVRMLEFSLSVVVLGLIGFTETAFHHEKTNFTVSTSAVSLFYILALYFSLLVINNYIVTGIVFFLENSILLLWLCAFFVTAKNWGSGSCGSETYDARKCRTAQATIAFSAVEAFLFLWTACVFNIEIFLVVYSKASKLLDLLKTNKCLAIKYCKFHGCVLEENTKPCSAADDNLEAGPVDEVVATSSNVETSEPVGSATHELK